MSSQLDDGPKTQVSPWCHAWIISGVPSAELAGLDPDKTRPITFGSPPKRFAGVLPGRSQLRQIRQALSLELAWSGQPLWLYRP